MLWLHVIRYVMSNVCYQYSWTGLNDQDQLVRQRQMLNKRLGLDMAGNLALGIGSDIFSDEDLLTGIKSTNGNCDHNQEVH